MWSRVNLTKEILDVVEMGWKFSSRDHINSTRAMPEGRRQVRPAASAEKKAAQTQPAPKPPTLGFVLPKRSIFLLMLGLPLFVVSSVVLYRRVVEGKEKRIQQGEYTPDGGLRIFSPQEKEERDKQSWMSRIFGSK